MSEERREKWSLAYWRGALEGAFHECEKLERALGLPDGVHVVLYDRLMQWRNLLNQLEEGDGHDD